MDENASRRSNDHDTVTGGIISSVSPGSNGEPEPIKIVGTRPTPFIARIFFLRCTNAVTRRRFLRPLLSHFVFRNFQMSYRSRHARISEYYPLPPPLHNIGTNKKRKHFIFHRRGLFPLLFERCTMSMYEKMTTFSSLSASLPLFLFGT